MLGCRQDETFDFPVVVYIRKEDLGDWIPADEALRSYASAKKATLRDDPLYEDFDEDSDCDTFLYQTEGERMY